MSKNSILIKLKEAFLHFSLHKFDRMYELIKEVEAEIEFSSAILPEETFKFIQNLKEFSNRRILDKTSSPYSNKTGQSISELFSKLHNQYGVSELQGSYEKPRDMEHLVGVYNFYPFKDGKHMFQGGLRTRNIFKYSMEKCPLVSVITTVLNRRGTLEKAMRSVLNQTYPNIELIVVDGGSADSTQDLILKYQNFIDYFISEQDESMYEGINKGISLSRGDYIIVLNSDDWFEYNAIEILMSRVLEQNLEWICALAYETDDHGNVLRKLPKIPFGENVMLRMPLRHETMLISKELYQLTGLYDTSYKIIGDLKQTQKLYRLDKPQEQLDEYVMYFRKNGVTGQLTDNFVSERKQLISENFPELNESEICILANEYHGDLEPYRCIVERTENNLLHSAIRKFLMIHSVRELDF